MSNRFASCGPRARSTQQSGTTNVVNPCCTESTTEARTHPEVVAPSTIAVSTPFATTSEHRGVPKNADAPVLTSTGPTALWAMVDAVAEAYQVARDLPFLLILSILSTCVGGRRKVRITPDWTEILSIYTATAMLPGAASPLSGHRTKEASPAWLTLGG